MPSSGGDPRAGILLHSRYQVLGGKTGFIYEAGYTLVTRLRREGHHDLIVVVMGCDSSSGSFRDARVLAEKAWLSDATLAVAR